MPSNASIAATIFAAIGLLGPQGRHFTGPVASPVEANVVAVEPRAVTVRVAGAPADERLSFGGPKIRAYQRAVSKLELHRCDVRPGDHILISRAQGDVVALLRADTAADPRRVGGDLCYLRTFFDLPPAAAVDDRQDVFYRLNLVLSLLEIHGPAESVFVRGDADSVLGVLSDAARVAEAARRYGQPRLADSTEQLIALKTALRGRTVLAEIIPYRYSNPGERPVGLHGFFIVRLFEDTGQTLVSRLDLSANVDRPPASDPKAPRNPL